MIGISASDKVIPTQVRLAACRNLICLSGKCNGELFGRILDTQGIRIEPNSPPFDSMVMAGLKLPVYIPNNTLSSLAIWGLGLLTVKFSWIEQFLLSQSSRSYSVSKRALAEIVLQMKSVKRAEIEVFRQALTILIEEGGESLSQAVAAIQEDLEKYS